MRPPIRIKIDNIKYSVRLYKKLIDELGVEVLGLCDSQNAKISVAKQGCQSYMLLTLMHECTHGGFRERALEECIKQGCLERVVDENAKFIIQLIQDNPGLVKYIQWVKKQENKRKK